MPASLERGIDSFAIYLNVRYSSGAQSADWPQSSSSNNTAVARADGSVAFALSPGTASITATPRSGYFTDPACSQPGTLPSISRQLTVKPGISGATKFWWFAGESPSGYVTSMILLATTSGSGSYQWAITKGGAIVNFSNDSTTIMTTNGQATVKSIGASVKANDVKVTVTVNGVTSDPFLLTVNAPHSLELLREEHQTASTAGYISRIHYKIKDQFGTVLDAGVPVNEKFTTNVVNDLSGANWTRGPAGGVVVTPSDWADEISGQDIAGAIPLPIAPQSPLGSTMVHHFDGEWRVGSNMVGKGRRVQTNRWQRYIDHASHLNRVSPAP
jgi:hypothetical protein